LNSTISWQIIDISSAVLSLVATGLVAYIAASGISDNGRIVIYSFLSLGFMVFQYARDPKKSAQGYGKAYKGIDDAISILEVDPTKDNLDALVSAQSKGEEIILRNT